MTLNLEVDEASQVNIITDLGKLSGRGTSDALKLYISSLGDFQMFGTYLISSGKFHYTAQELISKIFQISQGGSIRWTGDPVEADINLTAVYTNKADVGKLYTAAGYSNSNNTQMVISEAVMTLSGNLLRPDIKMDINFPQDPYIKDELQRYLSEASNRTQQALSFIARGSFASNTGLKLQAVNETVKNAFAELAFNRINDIFAKTLNTDALEVNLRSFNDASATLTLFNDRVILTGGISDTRNNIGGFDVIGNSFARDAEAQFVIKKETNRSITARYSYRRNNKVVLNRTQEYVNSLGLVYQKDFDTLGEFLRAVVGKSREDEEEEDDKPQGPPPPVNTNPTIVIVPNPSDQTVMKKTADK
jgi:hypothetical protein